MQLQEWLVERYRARLRLDGERDDGEKEDDLITAFRCELRAALQRCWQWRAGLS